MKKMIILTAALSLLATGSAVYAKPDHHKNKPHQSESKKTGLENALERGNKNERAKEAIRRAIERKKGTKEEQKWTDQQRVEADKKWVSIDFGGSDTKDNVTQAMALQTVGLYGSEISWSSSNTAVVSSDGLTVKRPAAGAGDVSVVLTATIKKGSYSAVKSFSIIVKQHAAPVSVVAADKEALMIGFADSDSANSVTKPITLPAIGKFGSVITWTSSHPAIISHDGKIVNRPAAGAGDASVTMTAVIREGAVSDTKTFKLTVKQFQTHLERVAADKAALKLSFASGDTASSVTRPFVLPTTGVNGSTITWVSSNTSIISANGLAVNRPAPGTGDAAVVLTAIITSGTASDVKSFTVTVKQQLTDDQKVKADKEVLQITFSGSDKLEHVTSPLTLAGAGVNGTSITWYSSYPHIVSNDGKTINRPAAGSGDVKVTLTAVISAGGYSDTKTFTITVKQQLTDTEKVASDKAALSIKYNGSDHAGSVTQSLSLPVTGVNGSSIVWVSSNTDFVTNTGVVARPAKGTGDVSIVLTAIMTSGNAAETKSFIVTVKQLSS